MQDDIPKTGRELVAEQAAEAEVVLLPLSDWQRDQIKRAMSPSTNPPLPVDGDRLAKALEWFEGEPKIIASATKEMYDKAVIKAARAYQAAMPVMELMTGALQGDYEWNWLDEGCESNGMIKFKADVEKALSAYAGLIGKGG